ncbi:hypothetical protein AU504_00430 [Lonsdalea populi]|nr:hypothetical protein AU508_02385 [Lonsdalea populi]RAT72616.1 hypothetical protein AU505_06500 [Lonsdalea populi]RAT73751.1 hypothetical protein AU504_00430 [Lonsdalea populi]RAT77434.1 hypothetical protein AU506_02300 [Lonsdalea populi]RAT79667.1 hypothetical protein AU507_02515 [Lonsdalea populi]
MIDVRQQMQFAVNSGLRQYTSHLLAMLPGQFVVRHAVYQRDRCSARNAGIGKHRQIAREGDDCAIGAAVRRQCIQRHDCALRKPDQRDPFRVFSHLVSVYRLLNNGIERGTCGDDAGVA